MFEKQVQCKAQLFSVLIVASLFAEVVVSPDPGVWNDETWVQHNAAISNNTEKMWCIDGLRVTAAEGVNWGLGNANPLTLTPVDDGSQDNRYDIYVSSYLRNLEAGDEFNIEFRGTPGGADWTISDIQMMLKTGTCAPKVIYDVDPAYTIDQIDSIIAESSFYDESLPFVDTLGMYGGDMSGGFIETFNGMTQIQVALPSEPFYQNNSWVTFEPGEYGNAMYMMALAMGQEYLNVDMQMMIGCG